MRFVSFYHKETGLFDGTHFMSSDDQVIDLNTPHDHLAIEGHHNPDTHRVEVETKEIVDHQPPAPSPDHEWDEETHRYNLSASAQAARHTAHESRHQLAQLRESLPELLLQHTIESTPASFNHLKILRDEITRLRKMLAE